MVAGNSSITNGASNVVIGNNTFVVGNNNTASGNNTYIFSTNSTVAKNNSLVVANYTIDLSQLKSNTLSTNFLSSSNGKKWLMIRVLSIFFKNWIFVFMDNCLCNQIFISISINSIRNIVK